MERAINLGNCHCGRRSRLWMCDWNDENYGRRYWGCFRNRNENQCGFVWWIDLPLCNRAKVVIPLLIRQKEMLEHEIGLHKEMELKVWAIAVVLWIHLIQAESGFEDMSFLCADMEVRGELTKKRNIALEDELILRKGREKKLWFALLVTLLILLSVVFK